MSTIQGILNLQAEVIENPEAETALRDAANRMQSMATLYDKLYRSENVREASLAEYLPQLVEEVVDLFPDCPRIQTEVEAENIVIHADMLVPLGIIVNEIVTNSLKHAFPGRDDGKLSVSAALLTQNSVRLIIEDNGPGFQKSEKRGNSESFGLSLVDLMVNHLKGAVKIETGAGSRFIIDFGL